MDGLFLIVGSHVGTLGESLAGDLGIQRTPMANELFPDGERHVRIERSLAGGDVFILQSTSAPVGESLVEVLLLADACRRSGAKRLFAIIPYLGYARQDRRTRGGEPISVRVVADLLAQARLDRLVLFDLHSPATEGCFSCPAEHLTAVPLLAEASRPFLSPDMIIVAPDLGAARLAHAYGRRFGLPVALVHKSRLAASAVVVEEVAGEVRDRTPFVVDDMISTGATIAAALEALTARGARADGAMVAATHGLFVDGAPQRLAERHIARLLVTDSVPSDKIPNVPVNHISLAPLVGEAIRRLHEGRSLADLIAGQP
ncbi:MAG: ribose-phosphate pyrophosphokinase [Planctomycetes bacterium]|nr:ribose-phosphate pyrophosphokinase [Planctomycetota bacterium]